VISILFDFAKNHDFDLNCDNRHITRWNRHDLVVITVYSHPGGQSSSPTELLLASGRVSDNCSGTPAESQLSRGRSPAVQQDARRRPYHPVVDCQLIIDLCLKSVPASYAAVLCTR